VTIAVKANVTSSKQFRSMFVAPCGEVHSDVRPCKSARSELFGEARVSSITGSNDCAIAGVDGATKLIATTVVRDTENPH